ncbi:MAG: hypothetical protein ACYC6P_11470 [Ignavibacteriaceae bacterium]
MEKQDYIKYWVKSSEEDLISMESIFIAGRYDWALRVVQKNSHKKTLKRLKVFTNV